MNDLRDIQALVSALDSLCTEPVLSNELRARLAFASMRLAKEVERERDAVQCAVCGRLYSRAVSK